MTTTMARPSDDHSTTNTETVERADADTNTREGRWTGSGNHGLPDGVIALRVKNDDRYQVTITDPVHELGYETGEDYLFCMFEPATDRRPAALRLEHLPDPDDLDIQTKKTKKIVGHNDSARYTIPKKELGEYGVGIDIENYDGEDPFLFEPVLTDRDDEFYLNPLGRVSEVFRYDPAITPPFPDSLIETVANEDDLEDDVDVHELRKRLKMVAKSLSKETFAAGGFPLEDDREVVSVNGQRFGIHLAPLANNRSAFGELLQNIYGASPAEATAIRRLNQKYADTLLSGLAASTDGEGAGHEQFLEPGTEPVVIPLDPPAENGDEQAGGRQATLGEAGTVQQALPTPIVESIVSLASTTHDVDADRVEDVLQDLAVDPPRDDLEVASERVELDEVTLPFSLKDDEPGSYSAVEVWFVEEDWLAETLVDRGVEEALAAAVRDTHNKQAERLITNQSSAPVAYRRFRDYGDAVLVPAPDA